MSTRPEVPHAALGLLVHASRISPELRAAVAEVEAYINAQLTDYDDATDCPICPQLATDRDDALGEVGRLRGELAAAVVRSWELNNEIDRLSATVDRATRYVRAADNLTEMARRGSQVFGKRWQDVIGFKPTSVTP